MILMKTSFKLQLVPSLDLVLTIAINQGPRTVSEADMGFVSGDWPWMKLDCDDWKARDE